MQAYRLKLVIPNSRRPANGEISDKIAGAKHLLWGPDFLWCGLCRDEGEDAGCFRLTFFFGDQTVRLTWANDAEVISTTRLKQGKS
jgi:hypothetical protein